MFTYVSFRGLLGHFQVHDGLRPAIFDILLSQFCRFLQGFVGELFYGTCESLAFVGTATPMKSQPYRTHHPKCSFLDRSPPLLCSNLLILWLIIPFTWFSEMQVSMAEPIALLVHTVQRLPFLLSPPIMFSVTPHTTQMPAGRAQWRCRGKPPLLGGFVAFAVDEAGASPNDQAAKQKRVARENGDLCQKDRVSLPFERRGNFCSIGFCSGLRGWSAQ